ncbi:hypothetical protein MUK42_30563, partial [Musa troglodytarum]
CGQTDRSVRPAARPAARLGSAGLGSARLRRLGSLRLVSARLGSARPGSASLGVSHANNASTRLIPPPVPRHCWHANASEGEGEGEGPPAVSVRPPHFERSICSPTSPSKTTSSWRASVTRGRLWGQRLEAGPRGWLAPWARRFLRRFPFRRSRITHTSRVGMAPTPQKVKISICRGKLVVALERKKSLLLFSDVCSMGSVRVQQLHGDAISPVGSLACISVSEWEIRECLYNGTLLGYTPVAVERIRSSKVAKPALKTLASLNNAKTSTAVALRDLGRGMDDRVRQEGRVPLKEVVADGTRRWFQDALKEARVGDAAMQVLVGQMHHSGYGVLKNDQKGYAIRGTCVCSSHRSHTPGYNASTLDSDDDGKIAMKS